MPSSIVQESGTGIVLPNKPYTYQDYLKIPVEQGVRYEILDGELIKEPAAPNIKHQVVSMNLVEILLAYFGKSDPSGMLFHPPIDVTLSDVTVVQPDLVFVSSEQKHILKECCIDGPPTLAIEIASPSSRRKDRFMKLQVYQEAGISHYWVVDPDEQTMQAYSLIDNTYTLVASGIDDDVLEHRDFPGLVIPLADLWQ
jgi:Uma2 family endonuclease